MKRSALPNQKKNYAMLKARMNEYSLLVERAYQSMCFEAAEIALSVGYDGIDEFFFKNYPQTKAALRQMQTRLVSSLSDVVYAGTSAEWKQSNLIQDLLATKVLSAYNSDARHERHKVYFQENNDALKAFLSRKEKGLTLSDKLWRQARSSQRQIEEALSIGIEKGVSAITLSKKLSQYLSDFPSMQKDYREKFGKASTAKNCEYQSMRLARTEINMAYRMAEQLRWKQMDFVLGYEIKLSGSHKVRDICDDVAGVYPKTFKFLGWHPNCYCYCIPVLKTEEQFYLPDSENDSLVKEMPNGFVKWIEKSNNLERMLKASGRGTLPYWLKENSEIKDCALLMAKAKKVGGIVFTISESIAKSYGGVSTPLNFKGFSSMLRKLRAESDISNIKDAVRTTIVVDNESIPDVITALKQHPFFSRYKHQRSEDFCGYSGNIINLKMPNGIQAEIQVNTPMMIYAKETETNARRILGDHLWESIAKDTKMVGGLGHKYYEEIRVLDMVKDKEIIAELVELSKKYYAHFK